MLELNMYLATLLGLGFLVLFGDMLVHGATQLSRILKVSDVFIGVVVVGLGTSLPEILTAVIAAFQGEGGIATGNVVGSNIANILLILGTALVLFGKRGLGFASARMDYAMMLLVTAVLLLMAALWGELYVLQGGILLALLAGVLYRLTHQGRSTFELDPNNLTPHSPTPVLAGKTVLALIGLWLGAELLVDGAGGIAVDFGLPPEVVGLSIVALGTSLPELAATFAAFRLRNGRMILGNVIGSNLLNILAALGLAALVTPLSLVGMGVSLGVMALAAVAVLPLFIWSKLPARLIGLLFLGGYVFYIYYIYS